MKKKVLKVILFAVLLYVAVIAIEICCIYTVQKDNTWNFLKEFWDWYSTLSIFRNA